MKAHAWQILVVALAGWLNRQQQDVVESLQEENRVAGHDFGAAEF